TQSGLCAVISLGFWRLTSLSSLARASRASCSEYCPPFALKDRLLKCWPELQLGVMQLAREGSRPPGLRLPQAELSRNSKELALTRIRRFESDMPSQAVASLRGMSCLQEYLRHSRGLTRHHRVS